MYLWYKQVCKSSSNSSEAQKNPISIELVVVALSGLCCVS